MSEETAPDAANAQSQECCEGCRYSIAVTDVLVLCRRKPPVPMIIGWTQSSAPGAEARPITESFFPPLRKTAWCGEFFPRMVFVPLSIVNFPTNGEKPN
jgi:hypothetical protein